MEDLFKGYFQGFGQNVFCAKLWKFLLALSGPIHNIHLLKDRVKDSLCISGDNCPLEVLFDNIVFRVITLL